MGCDFTSLFRYLQRILFQSTHPSWGATCVFCEKRKTCDISIHAPIVGCDSIKMLTSKILDYFNPRTHRGVRHRILTLNQNFVYISIHAPIVGCDLELIKCNVSRFEISIHAPIVGCDVRYARGL